MEKKKQVIGAGILFLVLVVIHIGIGFVDFGDIPIWASLLLSQGLIIVPVMIYFIITKQNVFQTIRFRKMNIWSFLLVIPLTGCIYPLLICVNAFSMAFSTNVIAGTMMGLTDETPYIISLSLMALLPAVVEETTFRGVLLNSFHRDSNPWPGILFSAICFAAMHMNFNQIAYALVLGICMGIILEASGSIMSTMLIHFIFNGTSTTMLYLMPKIMQWGTNTLEQSGEMSADEIEQLMDASAAAGTYTTGQMLLVAGMLLPFAIIGVCLAALLLYAIAKLNKRELILKGMFKRKTPEQKIAMKADRVKIMTIFLWIALGLCLAYAILTEVLIHMAG